MISSGLSDKLGRNVTLRPIGDDWRAVAHVAPADNQRDFAFALAGRYMLMTERGGPWTSLGFVPTVEVDEGELGAEIRAG